MTGKMPGRWSHGALAQPIRLSKDAHKVAEAVRPLMPAYHPAFEATLETYCILIVRIQRANDALEAWEDGEEAWQRKFPGSEMPESMKSLEESLRTWTSSALTYASQLGLTPASAAAILRDASWARGGFTPPSQGDLDRVPLDHLRKLQQVLTDALDSADIVDQPGRA